MVNFKCEFDTIWSSLARECFCCRCFHFVFNFWEESFNEELSRSNWAVSMSVGSVFIALPEV